MVSTLKRLLLALLIIFGFDTGALGFAGSTGADEKGEIITTEEIQAMKVTKIADVLKRLPGRVEYPSPSLRI